MNKKNLIIAGIVVLFLIGGLVVFLNKGGGDVADIGGEEKYQSEPSTESESLVGKFADILGANRDVTCEFKYSDGEASSNGMFYMTGGGDRIRGDFVVTQPGGISMETHMIRDGDWSYIWSSAMPQGIKSRLTEEQQKSLFESDANSDQAGISQIANPDTAYDCQNWNIDQSVFALPKEVEFVDLENQLREIQDQAKNIPVADCSFCEQIPDKKAKEQCLSAMSC